MASSAPRLERRRSQRLPIRIPVTLFATAFDGRAIEVLAEAIEVNQYGGLIRAPLSPGLGTGIELLNINTQVLEEFRVIRIREERVDGLFELGVEIMSMRRNFWGVPFPESTLA